MTMLERLDEIFMEYQALRAFAVWIHDKDIYLCKDVYGNYISLPATQTENIIMEYFGIDPNTLEMERRQLLANLQEQACRAPMRQVPTEKPASDQNKVKNIKDFKDMIRTIKRSKK